jgi:hypothetical protein
LHCAILLATPDDGAYRDGLLIAQSTRSGATSPGLSADRAAAIRAA